MISMTAYDVARVGQVEFRVRVMIIDATREHGLVPTRSLIGELSIDAAYWLGLGDQDVEAIDAGFFGRPYECPRDVHPRKRTILEHYVAMGRSMREVHSTCMQARRAAHEAM